MKRTPTLHSLWWTGIALLSMGATSGVAANLQEIARDTQRVEQTDGNMTMVWWLPQQFWEESMKANVAVPQEARDQVLGVLADYLVVAMMRAKLGPLGVTDAVPKDELLKNATLEVNGKVIAPIDPEKISQGAQLLLAQLKPSMAATVGQLGQSLEFIVYPTRVDEKQVIDPLQPGSLQISLFDKVFKWRLPLGSLLPDRLDAKTGEKFPGNYEFNPYTGTKLRN